MLEVLERSLGPAESHPVTIARSRLIARASSGGIRVPNTAVVKTVNDLRAWLAQNGFPAMLKADGTSGGKGVQIILADTAVEPVFERLSALSTAVGAPVLNVQRFIPGRDATSSVACWKGKIVASITCEVLETVCARGAASVLRLIDNPEMHQCAGHLIKQLGLSGIYGFDFRLEQQTGKAHLIEMNARPTQISHLAMGTGHDLPVALHAMLSGKSIPPTKRMTEKDTLVLFPQEWNRDPSSKFLASGFHDVPWREPGLIKSCIDNFVTGAKNCAQARMKHRLLQMLHKRTRQRQVDGPMA